MHTSKYRIVRGIAYQHVIERERSASAYYPVPYAAMLALLLHLVSECFSGEWFSVSIDDAVSRHLLVSGCKLSRMCTFHLCLSSLRICCRISYSSVQQQVVRTSAAGPSERTRWLKLHRRRRRYVLRFRVVRSLMLYLDTGRTPAAITEIHLHAHHSLTHSRSSQQA